MSRTLAAVAAGGLAGAALRWALVAHGPDGRWPWAVFLVNVAGSFVLGLIVTRWVSGDRRLLRLGLGTGFCGALTTFSTLTVDVATMLRTERVADAAGYLVVSILAGIVAVWGGMSVARRGGLR